MVRLSQPVEPLSSYHKLVKTTPKPSATKKSNGELCELLEVSVGLGVGDGIVGDADEELRVVEATAEDEELDDAVGVGVDARLSVTCRAMIAAPSNTTG